MSGWEVVQDSIMGETLLETEGKNMKTVEEEIPGKKSVLPQ